MPTLSQTAQSTNFASSATNKDIAGVNWAAGDLIVVRGVTGDNATVSLNAPTNAGLSFAAVSGYPTNTASTTKHYAWTATAAGSGSSQTIAGTMTPAGEAGYTVEVWTSHGGLGTIMTNTHGTSGAPQGTISVTDAASAVSAQVGHWNQASGARTYLTNAGAASEFMYLDTGTFGTTMGWTHNVTGGTGNKVIGVSAPTGTNWWIIAFEILPGAAAAWAVEPRRDFEPTRFGPF